MRIGPPNPARVGDDGDEPVSWCRSRPTDLVGAEERIVILHEGERCRLGRGSGQVGLSAWFASAATCQPLTMAGTPARTICTACARSSSEGAHALAPAARSLHRGEPGCARCDRAAQADDARRWGRRTAAATCGPAMVESDLLGGGCRGLSPSCLIGPFTAGTDTPYSQELGEVVVEDDLPSSFAHPDSSNRREPRPLCSLAPAVGVAVSGPACRTIARAGRADLGCGRSMRLAMATAPRPPSQAAMYSSDADVVSCASGASARRRRSSRSVAEMLTSSRVRCFAARY